MLEGSLEGKDEPHKEGWKDMSPQEKRRGSKERTVHETGDRASGYRGLDG